MCRECGFNDTLLTSVDRLRRLELGKDVVSSGPPETAPHGKASVAEPKQPVFSEEGYSKAAKNPAETTSVHLPTPPLPIFSATMAHCLMRSCCQFSPSSLKRPLGTVPG